MIDVQIQLENITKERDALAEKVAQLEAKIAELSK